MPNSTDTDFRFATVDQALAEIAAGRMVVVVDDEDRENEGDLVMAAEFATHEAINFMAKHARGWICLALTGERCDELGLELMTAKNETPHETPFTVTIEAREGVTTGISAADRAHTIRVASDPKNGPEAIVKGGHVNPLKAKPGGVLERTGHTEAGVDLARLAGCTPAGVICEIMNDDGSMARLPDLKQYCATHGLKMLTIADLIAYRRKNDRLVERVVKTTLPTTFGDFTVVGYRSLIDDKHHVALVKGEVDGAKDVIVRVHSECLTGDVFVLRFRQGVDRTDLFAPSSEPNEPLLKRGELFFVERLLGRFGLEAEQLGQANQLSFGLGVLVARLLRADLNADHGLSRLA